MDYMIGNMKLVKALKTYANGAISRGLLLLQTPPQNLKLPQAKNKNDRKDRKLPHMRNCDRRYIEGLPTATECKIGNRENKLYFLEELQTALY